MNRPTSRVRRHHLLDRAVRPLCEPMEPRRLLCALHAQTEPPTELMPGVKMSDSAAEGNTPADIRWVNRNADRFDEVFGANQDAARRVVDAVIEHYERMIPSFNYIDDTGNYDVTIEMEADNATSPNGLGA